MYKYKCTVCDYIYDPIIGDPEHGVRAGTIWEDVPEDWLCPVCGVPMPYVFYPLLFLS